MAQIILGVTTGALKIGSLPHTVVPVQHLLYLLYL